MLLTMARGLPASAIGLLAAIAAGAGSARGMDDPAPAAPPAAVAAAVPAPAPAPTPAPAPAPAATPTSFPAGAVVTVTLTNGDVFHAAVITDSDPLVIEHALIGKLSIARERIRSVVADAPPGTPVPPPTPAPAPATPAAPEVKYVAPALAPPPPVAEVKPPQLPAAPPPEPGLLDLWKFSFEGGVNGTAGKTPVQSFRGVVSANRATPEMNTTSTLGWWYSRADDEETQERVQLDARNEWPSTPKSSWGYYVAGRTEYDQFQQWDWRLSGQAGLSFKLWQDETLTINARSGFGASREFGVEHPDVHAEFTPAIDLELRLNPRNKICASMTGNVDLENTDGSRANFKAWYEAVLDPEHGMSLKVGVEDRYERMPAFFREKHEIDYFAVIVFTF